MIALLLSWIISAAAVWAAVEFVPGISLEGTAGPYFAVALILGLVNAVVRPFVRFLSCGLIFFTLGLFLLVINAGMLLLSARIAQAFGVLFQVDGFGPALFGSLVITIVSFLGSRVLLPEPEKGR